MNNHTTNPLTRIEQLRARCAVERQQLAQQFSAIEIPLQTTDKVLSIFTNAIKRPELWLAGLAGVWAIKRVSVWSLISRSWMLWSTARRVIRWFKH